VKRGNLPARKCFRQAVEVARTAALPRQEAEANLHLSQFYRATNQLAKAVVTIDQGIQAMQRVEEATIFPISLPKRPKCRPLSDRSMPRCLVPARNDLVEACW